MMRISGSLSRAFRWLATGIGSAGLVSCASIQVDMDVYKGPFANHEEVEVEQFAVLAGAAKPILTKLQTLVIDDALSERDEYNREILASDCANYYGEGEHCETSIFQDGVSVRRNTRQPAFFVDQVLSLYDDEAGFQREVEQLNRLRSDFEKFRTTPNREYQNSWALTDAIETLHRFNVMLVDAGVSVKATNANIRVKNQIYREIGTLLANTLDMRNIAIIGQLSFCGNKKSDAVLNFMSAMASARSDDDDRRSNDHIVGRRRWTCDVGGEKRLVRSEDLWDGGGEETTNTNSEYEASRRDLQNAAFSQVFDDAPEETLFALKDLLETNLENSANDLVLTGRSDAESALSKFKGTGRHRIPGDPRNCTGIEQGNKCRPWSAEYRGNKPYPWGESWAALANPNDDTLLQNLDLRGLAPLLEDLRALDSAFGDTRLRDGIETLVRNYLEKSDACRANGSFEICPDAEHARERLSFALIHFAQKITYLADNEVLLDNYDRKIRQHIRVLQAIGNTIMVLADDSRRLAERDDPALIEIEAAAARRALISDPQSQMIALIRTMKDREGDERSAVNRLNSEIERLKTQAKSHAVNLKNATPFFYDSSYNGEVNFEEDDGRDALNDYAAQNKPALAAYRFIYEKYAEKLKKDLVTEADQTKQITDKAFNQEVIDKLTEYASDDRELQEALPDLTGESGYLNKSPEPLDDNDMKSRQAAWGAHKTRVKNRGSDLTALIEIADQIRIDTKRPTVIAGSQQPDLYSQRITAESLRDRHAIAESLLDNIKKETPNINTAVTGSSRKMFFDWVDNEINSSDAPQSDKDQTLAAVKEYRSGITIVPPDTDVLLTKRKTDRADVLDYIISELKYAHIETIRTEGESSQQAERLKAALDAAYDYRGGFAYIRPAGTYLRSSYAAATLQRSSSIYQWTNMLAEQGRRAFVPFYRVGTDKVFDRRGAQDRQILAEIDKQFWQTINTVRVAGAGNTNYVIAKDDVGNFYVKGVATDPKVIVRSMKNLALFGLGSSAGVNLLQRDGEDRLVITDNSTPMQSLYKKYEDRYIASTKATLDSVNGMLTDERDDNNNDQFESSLLRKLTGSWTEDDDKDALNSAMNGAAAVLKTARENHEKKQREYNEANNKNENDPLPATLASGQDIIDGVYEIRKFQQSLDSALVAVKLTVPDGAKETVEQKRFRLRQSAAGLIDAELKPLLEARIRAMDEFQTGVSVLGDISAEAASTTSKEENANDDSAS